MTKRRIPKINRWFDWLGRYCALISVVSTVVLLVFLTLVIAVDVIGRGVFSRSILIADAASGYTLIGIAFLGLAYTELEGGHITVSVLTRRLPSAKREHLEVAILIMTLVFSIFFTWLLFDATKMNYRVTSVDVLRIRMWIPYSVGPIGSGMFAVVLLTKVVQKLKKLKGLVNSKDIKDIS